MLTGMGHPGWRGNNSSFSKSTNKGVNSNSIGRYKRELTNKEISKLDCSRVKFYGELKQEDLDIIYKNCDIGLSLCLSLFMFAVPTYILLQ